MGGAAIKNPGRLCAPPGVACGYRLHAAVGLCNSRHGHYLRDPYNVAPTVRIYWVELSGI